MKNLRKFLQLSWAEQWLLIRATWWLGVLTLGVRTVPLPTLQRLFLKPTTRRAKTAPAQCITRAIRAASRFVPGAVCLPQAFTAQYLLVQSGYPAELQIGAARSADGKLEAHAWVISEGVVVIGGLGELDRFVPLSSTQRDAEHLSYFGAHLTSEAQLLLCCAHTQMDAPTAKQITTLLQGGIDWASLLQMALRHKLAPLLYRNLEALCPTEIPEAVRGALKDQSQVDVQGNLFLTGELLRLLALFRQHGVAVAPYKGPVLAILAYGDLALRPFRDLDILVHEQDIAQAVALLAGQGYQIIEPANIAQADQSRQSFQIHRRIRNLPWAYQLVLSHAQTQAMVELHWRVTPSYICPVTSEQLWASLQPFSLAGTTLHSFAPEQLLWFLCVHGAKHGWGQLKWTCDVAELIRACPNLNWEQIMAQAAELRIERRVCLGLLLATSLLDTPLPQVVKAKIQANPQVRMLAQRVVGRLFDEADQGAEFRFTDRFSFSLMAMDRMADRARYVSKFVRWW